MKNTVGSVLSLKKLRIIKIQTKDKITFLFYFLIIGGIFIGIFSSSKNTVNFKIGDYLLEKYLLLHKNSTNVLLICKTFLNFLTLDILLYFLTVSLLGIILIPFYMLSLGIIVGTVIAQSYVIYQFKGIAFNALVLAPTLAVFIISVVSVSKYNFEFSSNLSKMSFNKFTNGNLAERFAKLTKKNIILIIMSLVASLVDFTLNKLANSLFNL